MFSEDLGFLNLGSCFLRTNGLGSWLMFLEDQGILDLAHVFRGFLDFGSCFQRTKVVGSWLMFLEEQGFLDLGSCF